MIKFKLGNVLQESDQKRIIIHVVSNKGGFGKGFASSVAKKYPQVKKIYKEWYNRPMESAKPPFKLGSNQYINIDENLTFINMLAQNGYKSKSNPVPLDYDMLGLCLLKVRQYTKGFEGEIWMPDLIGCGLAGDNREKVLELIEEVLNGREVVIYKYE